jgi:hypothetical protein
MSKLKKCPEKELFCWLFFRFLGNSAGDSAYNGAIVIIVYFYHLDGPISMPLTTP